MNEKNVATLNFFLTFNTFLKLKTFLNLSNNTKILLNLQSFKFNYTLSIISRKITHNFLFFKNFFCITKAIQKNFLLYNKKFLFLKFLQCDLSLNKGRFSRNRQQYKTGVF